MDNEKREIITRSVTLSAHSKWEYNTNFSYKVLTHETHVDEEAQSSLFNSSIIEQNVWNAVILDNSDFEATKFLQSNIEETSFKNCDCSSIVASDTVFRNVKFCGSNIVDAFFIDCIFISCDFSYCTLTHSEFYNCTFKDVLFERGSYLSNKFSQCTFESIIFKNVFYYTFFDSCKFLNSTMEAYLLGYSYGLDDKNLQSLQFLLMGDMCNINITSILKKIETIYKERGMFMNHVILTYYDETYIDPSAQVSAYKTLYNLIANEHIAKKDMVQFFHEITVSMYKNNKIPIATFIKIIVEIDKILCLENNISSMKISNQLHIIKNDLLGYCRNHIDSLAKLIEADYDSSNMIVKLKYKNKPKIELASILRKLDSTGNATVIRAERGSFLEWILCTENTIKCIELFFSFMGVVIPLVIYELEKKHKKPLTTSVSSRTTVEAHTSIEQTTTDNIVFKSNVMIQTEIVTNVISVITSSEYDLLGNQGYTIKNIISIEKDTD